MTIGKLSLDGNHMAAHCRCDTCRFTSSVARIQRKLNRYDRAIIEKLLNKWAHADTDAVYYRLKLEGKWPQPKSALDMCPNCVTPWKCNGPHIA